MEEYNCEKPLQPISAVWFLYTNILSANGRMKQQRILWTSAPIVVFLLFHSKNEEKKTLFRVCTFDTELKNSLRAALLQSHQVCVIAQ